VCSSDLPGLELLDGSAARRLEPNLACTVALHSPRTGVVDSHALMLALLGEIEDHGGALALRTPVEDLSRRAGQWQAAFGGAEPGTMAFDAVVNAASFGAPALAATAIAAATALAGPGRRVVALVCAGSVFVIAGIYPGFNLPALTVGRDRARDLVYFKEGRTVTVGVTTTQSGDKGLRLNDLGHGGLSALPPRHSLESLLLALISLTHVEDPEKVMVVGLGVGVSIDLLDRFPSTLGEALEVAVRGIDFGLLRLRSRVEQLERFVRSMLGEEVVNSGFHCGSSTRRTDRKSVV